MLSRAVYISVANQIQVSNCCTWVYACIYRHFWVRVRVRLGPVSCIPSPSLPPSPQLEVSVRDENDNFPQCPPSSLLETSVALNSSAGTQVLSVTATDADITLSFRTLTYQIRGRNNEEDYFSVTEVNGTALVSLTSALPRQNTYQFDVEVVDGGSLSTRCAVVVEVYRYEDTVTVELCNITEESFAVSRTTFASDLSDGTGVEVSVASYQSTSNM